MPAAAVHLLVCIWFLDKSACCKGTSYLPLHGKRSFCVESFMLAGDQIILIPSIFQSWFSFSVSVEVCLTNLSHYKYTEVKEGYSNTFEWGVLFYSISCLLWLPELPPPEYECIKVIESKSATCLHLWFISFTCGRTFQNSHRFSLSMETTDYFPAEEG